MLVGFIIFYLLGTLAIGYWASRRVKSTQDFVIAGRKLPLGVAASALFATWFGSETIMGASSEFVSGGVLGVIEDPFGAALCLILVGAFVARPLYKLNILTFNDYFRIRYDRRTEVISAVFTVPSYFGWIAAQLIALAIILQLLLGVPLWAGILICMLVVLFYTYIGGMWAVSVTDFVQTIIIVLGLSVLFFSITDQADGLENVIQNTPEDFFNILPTSDLHSMVHYFAAWITIGLGSIPQQDIFQRVMAAKSEKVSVQSAYLAGIMYLTIGFLPLMIGLAGSQIYPEVLAEKDPQMALPQLVLHHAGLPLQILFFGALLSAILSTTSGAMLAPATVIGENLVRLQFKNLSDKQILQIMRWCVLGVALCSAGIAFASSNIYELVGQSASLSLVSLFVPLAAGLYWKRANRHGSFWAIVLGGFVWLVCEIVGTSLPSLVYGLMASIAAMIAGSLLTTPKMNTSEGK